MPKQAPPMATDDEMNKLLKERGYDPKTGQKVGAQPAAPSAQPPAADPAKPYEDMSWTEKMGEGVAKSAAQTGVAIPRLAEYALPQSAGEAIEGSPTFQRMEQYAESPFEGGGWDRAGYWLTEAAQMLMGPGELKLGSRLGTKFFPRPVFTKGAGFAAAPNRALKAGGDVAEAAARGGAAGAQMDPKDPGTGAVAGAVGGSLSPTLGALAQSPAGKFLGEHIPRIAASGVVEELARHLGVPREALWMSGIIPFLRWWHSPFGRKIGEAGGRATKAAGDYLRPAGHAPQAAGAAAGAGAEELKD